jgi:hypothetical protein
LDEIPISWDRSHMICCKCCSRTKWIVNRDSHSTDSTVHIYWQKSSIILGRCLMRSVFFSCIIIFMIITCPLRKKTHLYVYMRQQVQYVKCEELVIWMNNGQWSWKCTLMGYLFESTLFALMIMPGLREYPVTNVDWYWNSDFCIILWTISSVVFQPSTWTSRMTTVYTLLGQFWQSVSTLILSIYFDEFHGQNL